eukprot:CAMPEP_0197289824 /NCGR_PEP_ID=MMETSP0890-20130614/7087_1 /TAXON_ID=44058 ORGANISM="Aureoumbra lagunensis, Strain CCMP1510" /NCGR_SAMPLE_ID=MMETSP0890 /ASSEMBLY_ACC=CAM_ASM_000533 /LENGTH=370 /DNA_ID=CAMNT_0042761465 /DNA_START=223 /DNA_END=1335 /DNA_ORIENTATION=-
MPRWLENFDDESTGKWSVSDGELNLYDPESGKSIIASISLDENDSQKFQEPLLVARKNELTGNGFYRVREICNEKMVWLGHSLNKLGLIGRYVKREKRIIDLVCSVVERAHHIENETTTVLDLGANHGLYSLLAAAKGAKVWGIEPQTALSSLVQACAAVNGFDHNSFHIFRNLILDADPGKTIEFPELAMHSNGEGGAASIGMPTAQAANLPKYAVTTISVSKLADQCFHSQSIAFMKVDVEGVELPALRSAMPLFQHHKIKHAVVEFGPLSRWKRLSESGVENNGQEHAALLLASLRNLGYRTAINTAGQICKIFGNAICLNAPAPHKSAIAELKNDEHLNYALSLNHELSLFIDLIHNNTLFPSLVR